MAITNGQLYIRKRTLTKWLTLFIFIFPFFLSFFMDLFHFPGLTKYTIDVAWVLAFASLLLRKSFTFNRKITPFVVLITLWLIYVTIIHLFQYQSVFYYLWGIRNNFRFYVAFFAFALVLDDEDIGTCFQLTDFLFWVNGAVSLVQFAALGYRQDNLGGIFGVEKGCNAYTTILLAIVITRSIICYMEQKEKAWLCYLKCAVALLLAAMAEIKFFFVLFILIFVMSSLLTKFSWRKVVVFIVAALFVSVAGKVLTGIFGVEEQLTLERILNLVTSSNYATAEDLGRFTAIPTISERFLTNFFSKLFGMGIGNCDTSAFAICNTPFFQAHENLHYNWFSSAMLFLETGYIGLMMNLGFFAMCFLSAFKQFREEKTALYPKMGMIFAVICIILTFYNSALRKEVGYLAYFVLALPMISGTSTAANPIAEKRIPQNFRNE